MPVGSKLRKALSKTEDFLINHTRFGEDHPLPERA